MGLWAGSKVSSGERPALDHLDSKAKIVKLKNMKEKKEQEAEGQSKAKIKDKPGFRISHDLGVLRRF